MKKPEKMIIYNLFPLLAGRIEEWDKHLARAAEMWFNWVFVNPIQRTGDSGSLYSIADHFDFNPLMVDTESALSAEEQVKKMIETAERLGLKMMVDLVINHCSVDSGLLRSHPEWFVWEGTHIAHPGADENGKKVVWTDLAKFDHRETSDKEGLYHYCLKVVEYLIALGFRGFRCDAAYQVPRSLWKRLIDEIRMNHGDVLFFAETLGCTPDLTRKTASAGFDYIFNSSKWWDYNSPWLMQQYALTRDIAPSISFPESHDTVRLCEELNGNINGLKQRYLFAALFSGGVMMPMGYEFGFCKRMHIVKTRPEDWEETGIDLTSFITKVNSTKASRSIFQEDGPVMLFHFDNPQVLFMWKASVGTNEEALIIINKDIDNYQHFYVENIGNYLQTGAAPVDISPEYQLDSIPSPYIYDLRPGQGIVLVTSRDEFPEE
jgi:starch synthase (maltosyl-transferring)